MSDEVPNEPNTPPERARIEPAPPSKRRDGLPLLYIIGFVVLAAAVFYVYRNPTRPREAAQEAARVDALTQEAVARQQQYEILTKRLVALESKQAPAPANLAPLEAKVAALENRPPPSPPADLGPLKSQLDAIEKKQAETAQKLDQAGQQAQASIGPVKSELDALKTQQAELGRTLDQAGQQAQASIGPVKSELDTLKTQQAELGKKLDQAGQQAESNLAPVKSQLAALEKKQSDTASGTSGKLDQVTQRIDALGSQVDKLGSRLDAVEAQSKETGSALASLKGQAQQVGQLQAANVALNAGQPLGEIEGAPPALAQFAHSAPPTESGLRLSFEKAAEAARHASQPALTDNQNFVDRMWTRAQQSVTIRQGDNVVVGDPISGYLASAREKLDAGDLSGAVNALDGLAGPARAAMSGWIDQAQSLLNARAAIAKMAART